MLKTFYLTIFLKNCLYKKVSEKKLVQMQKVFVDVGLDGFEHQPMAEQEFFQPTYQKPANVYIDYPLQLVQVATPRVYRYYNQWIICIKWNYPKPWPRILS